VRENDFATTAGMPAARTTRAAISIAEAAAEIAAGDDDVARRDPPGEVRVDVLHQILRQRGSIQGVALAPRRDDVIGVDVVAEAMASVRDSARQSPSSQRDPSGHRARRDDGRRRKVDVGLDVAHPADEVAVGGRDDVLAGAGDAGARAAARPAGRRQG